MKAIKIMKWSLLFLVFFLSACGFRPIYATHGENASVAAALNAIEIANIQDKSGQSLRNRLIDRLYIKGRPSTTNAVLEISLSIVEVDLGQQRDATSSRQELNLKAFYVLKNKTGQKLLSGTARSIVNYAKLSAQYGTLATQQNAVDRALIEVSEQIVNRLALYYAETPKVEDINAP